eukprot:gene341-610_t
MRRFGTEVQMIAAEGLGLMEAPYKIDGSHDFISHQFDVDGPGLISRLQLNLDKSSKVNDWNNAEFVKIWKEVITGIEIYLIMPPMLPHFVDLLRQFLRDIRLNTPDTTIDCETMNKTNESRRNNRNRPTLGNAFSALRHINIAKEEGDAKLMVYEKTVMHDGMLLGDGSVTCEKQGRSLPSTREIYTGGVTDRPKKRIIRYSIAAANYWSNHIRRGV